MGFQRNGGPEPAEAGLSGGHLGFALLRLVPSIAARTSPTSQQGRISFDAQQGATAKPEGPWWKFRYHRFFQKNFAFCRRVASIIQSGLFQGLHVPGLLKRMNLLNLACLSPEQSSAGICCG
jgi:hypothetical protein